MIYANMKKHFLLFLLFLTTAFLLSSCGSGYVTTSWPGVAVNADGNTAYAAYGGHIYAVNLENGTEIWRYPEKAENAIQFYATPALTPDGQVIVGDYGHTLYSLDAKTGALKWKFEQAHNRYIAGALVAGNAIYAPNADGNLYAVSFSGSALWEQPFHSVRPLWATPTNDPDCECIYLAAMDHHLYTINPNNGEVRWKSEDLGGAMAGTPTFMPDGKIFAGTFANELVALDQENGSIIGVPYLANSWIWSGPALAGDRLYFGDILGNFYILSAVDLSEVKVITGTDPIVATPLIVDEIVYVVNKAGVVQAYDMEGNALWKQTVTGKLYTTPVLNGESILVGVTESDTLLIAFNLDGAQKWSFTPAK